MLAPLRWIYDYVKNTNEDVRTVADKMVMTGNGVEDILSFGQNIENVVAGKIIAIEKHPDADKLLVCSIDAGGEKELQIVTGADNVFVGAVVPVALHGAALPTGQTIKKGKLRGLLSEGMLCSGEELCLKESDYPGAEEHGILILKESVNPGEDIKKVLGLSADVIDFEVGANRPDCLSILGIAREAAAALNAPFAMPEISYKETTAKIDDIVSVEVLDRDLCTRYIARAVCNVKIEESPDWIKTRLTEAGIRPINNIVDITNFVMLETGQPMHAFDAADIRGKKIIVRRAKNGETMKTLDGRDRAFSNSMLLICDSEGPIGVAGVMGGENSEIKPDTTTVVFESAKFMYGNIRQTSRALGMSTESSMRFSKGIDAATTKFAMDRALTMVAMLGAGEITQGEIDILSEDLTPKVVNTSAEEINTLLGTQLSAKQMKEYLDKVTISTEITNNALQCSIPLFRSDIAGSADIAEEVARMYGYDNIAAMPILGEIRKGCTSVSQQATDTVKSYLANAGFNECVTYSFTGEMEYKKLNMDLPASVRIINPLGDDTALMRTTLIADMLKVVSTNLSRKNKDLKLFEVSKIFLPNEDGTQLPEEYPVLCIAVCGAGQDFFSLKGIIENILLLLSASETRCARSQKAYLHPGVSAEVFAGNTLAGEIGEVHPDICENFDIGEKVFIAQIRLDALLKIKKPLLKYTQLPKYPAVERDLAVVVEEEAGAGEILSSIKKAGGKKLSHAQIFDVYRDAKLGENKKSLAYTLEFRAPDKTMTDEETNGIMEKILRTLEREFNAKLRL